MKTFLHCIVYSQQSKVTSETPGANGYFMSGAEVAKQLDDIVDNLKEHSQLHLPKAFNFSPHQLYPVGLVFLPHSTKRPNH